MDVICYIYKMLTSIYTLNTTLFPELDFTSGTFSFPVNCGIERKYTSLILRIYAILFSFHRFYIASYENMKGLNNTM